MDRLEYGGGICTLNANGIRAIQIHFSGAIEITDNTPPEFKMKVRQNKIIIFPISSFGNLAELFEYVGYFKITSVYAVDDAFKFRSIFVKQLTDFSNFLHTKAEALTRNSEDIDSTFLSEKHVSKTRIVNK